MYKPEEVQQEVLLDAYVFMALLREYALTAAVRLGSSIRIAEEYVGVNLTVDGVGLNTAIETVVSDAFGMPELAVLIRRSAYKTLWYIVDFREGTPQPRQYVLQSTGSGMNTHKLVCFGSEFRYIEIDTFSIREEDDHP